MIHQLGECGSSEHYHSFKVSNTWSLVVWLELYSQMAMKEVRVSPNYSALEHFSISSHGSVSFRLMPRNLYQEYFLLPSFLKSPHFSCFTKWLIPLFSFRLCGKECHFRSILSLLITFHILWWLMQNVLFKFVFIVF